MNAALEESAVPQFRDNPRKCLTPMIRLVAYEDRDPTRVFVSVPDQRGRFIRVPRCVIDVGCPHCQATVGEPCKGNGGYLVNVHMHRQPRFAGRAQKGGDFTDYTRGLVSTTGWDEDEARQEPTAIDVAVSWKAPAQDVPGRRFVFNDDEPIVRWKVYRATVRTGFSFGDRVWTAGDSVFAQKRGNHAGIIASPSVRDDDEVLARVPVDALEWGEAVVR